MSDARRLWLVRALHTGIYAVMSAAILLIVVAGLFGGHGPWLWLSLGLAGLEALVFAASGLKCPLTAVVARYAGGADVSDTFLPTRFTRHTLAVFGPLLLFGLALLALRWLRGF